MPGAVRAGSGFAHEPVDGEIERFATRVRGELVSAGAEGDALIQEVTLAAATLRRLLAHTALFPGRSKALAVTVDELEDRLSRRELSVVVVGERGAGKTTFLDALIGHREIGLARGESLVLTLFRRGPAPDYRARLESGKVEEFSSRHPDRSAKHEATLVEEDGRLGELEGAARAVAREVRELHRRKSRARAELVARRAGMVQQRAEAERLDARLRQAKQDAEHAGAAVVRAQRVLPVSLHSAPASWALWAWLLFVVLWAFKHREWRAYSRERRTREDKERGAGELERQAALAAAACADTGAELAPFFTELDRARAELAEARRALVELRGRLAAQRALAEQARAELGRHRDERLARFYSDIKSLSDASGRGREVIELTIELPARSLPNDVTLIDAPALTSADGEQQRRAFEAIRERADGCILLSELDRGVGRETQRFVQRLRNVVPHVLLVLTKMDQAYVDARRRAKGDPWDQVEHARRIGTRRFAREIGHSPDTVLSVSVAAQATLDDESSVLGRRFEAEVQKLFRLLRQERALILGTRSASAVQSLIAEVAEAKPRVARAYEALIAALEAKRVPEPEAFRAQALDEARPEIAAAAERATDAAVNALRDAFWLIRSDCVKHVDRATRRRDLAPAAARCEKEIQAGILRAKAGARTELESAIDLAVRKIELGIFDQLRNRYRLIHEVRRASTSLVEADFAIEPVPREVSLAPAVRALVVRDRRARVALGLGGALTLGLAGLLVGGPAGALAGLLLGPLVALARTRTALVRRALGDLDGTLGREALALREELAARRPGLEAAIYSALDASVRRAITKFSRAMAVPLEAERRAIETERRHLGELDELATALASHDDRLSQLVRAAQEASLGLCR